MTSDPKYQLHQAGAFFVTRLKANTRFYVAKSRLVNQSCGLRCDQTIILDSPAGRAGYPEKLRRISFMDPQTGKALVFVTNQFDLDALIVAQIYRRRWAIELFFRWIKQHLRLRRFYSTSFNGVRVQICACLLVAIAKRRLNLPHSLWKILQILSIASMEQIAFSKLLTKIDTRNGHIDTPNQLELNYP